ncbi:cystathionine gamma-synthase [Chryseoglobus sp. 28M-23]|uniref:cystathionine gamma-synthase n=1 Tax=Chryseoglobus sp. 28M-23 TaxID=2772253 RepID=UPI001745C95F|nr:cystathionine gamma-synthase [Chryseoglobus sp. 28M-23]MBU1249701.1 cystathionine gamma-synthase [Actinomycetota bacterium]MBU1608787.1 cystathionine gamma-synthase [Actinomycetota bacterium]MBU2314824.1 cystathionine gamma-synthase [Actinomycetota bacterium]MBU2385848.1 cystathionine gamma-synthase [Actinomycetota bacterium]QOD93402.1 cystathionine gamma-synthase [Chryseoglobus sp. 28M-23]
MTDHTDHGFATRAIHAGQDFDPTTGAIIPPVYFTSTFVQEGIGRLRGGYEYARGGNPTRDALQEQLAALEGAAHAVSFASGLAAEDALLRAVLRPGDHVLMGNDVYGGTHRLVRRIFGDWGIGLTTMALSDPDAVRAALADLSPRVLWLETPSNPMMTVTDIAQLAEIGHAAGALVVVDNTFATPYLQQPLALGADVVVHSTTKYLGGHSDVLGGAIVTSDPELAQKVQFQQFAAGAVSGPMDAWLTSRGIKTLAVRMERHSANAQAIAEAIEGQAAVARVHYPGLPSHPDHALAARQMRLFGGMLSLELAGGGAAARAFAEGTRLFQLAESLGGVESLMNYPSEMTHASVRGTELEVPDSIVRLSVGIEEADDLVADVLQALARL